MNITIISPFYYPTFLGGAEISVRALAEWLASNGFTVRVISFDGRTGSETINNVKVTRYPVILTKSLPLPVIANKALALTLAYPVLKAMKKLESKTDVYHVCGVYPIMGAGLYKLLNGKKAVVATLDNYAGFCPVSTAMCSSCDRFRARTACLVSQSSRLEKPLGGAYALIYPILTRLAKKVDKYIAPSDNVAKLYARYGFDPEKIKVIPNFINIKDKKHCKAEFDNSRFNILYVGAMSNHKGVGILIHAFKIIAGEKSEPHLTLVGRGNLFSYYKVLVEDLKINDRVTFTGYIEDHKLAEMYAEADVFVHPAQWMEPFGLTLLEALLNGVPCLVSDAVSPEIIGNAGLVFRHDNVEDLANKLRVFMADKELKSRLTYNCTEMIKRYDAELICRRISDLYDVICKPIN